MSEKAKLQFTIIGLAVLILCVCFYWFQLRPINIRKSCSKISEVDAAQIAQSNSKEYRYWNMEKGSYLLSDRDYSFSRCLAENGIK